jgi:hypothetical protein
MTAARAAKLEALGLAYERSAAAIQKWKNKKSKASGAEADRPKMGNRDAVWEAQLAKLKEHQRKHGGCSVTQDRAEDSTLARWTMKQRTLKKTVDRGEPSEGMTAARAAKLDALGFAWGGTNTAVASWEAQLAKLEAHTRRHGD